MRYEYKVIDITEDKENDKSEKLFSNEKNNKFENIIAIKNVNQSDAIVVFTLLFLT